MYCVGHEIYLFCSFSLPVWDTAKLISNIFLPLLLVCFGWVYTLVTVRMYTCCMSGLIGLFRSGLVKRWWVYLLGMSLRAKFRFFKFLYVCYFWPFAAFGILYGGCACCWAATALNTLALLLVCGGSSHVCWKFLSWYSLLMGSIITWLPVIFRSQLLLLSWLFCFNTYAGLLICVLPVFGIVPSLLFWRVSWLCFRPHSWLRHLFLILRYLVHLLSSYFCEILLW